jgi:hypothetical protein
LSAPHATGGRLLSEDTETQELEALGAAINRVCGVLLAVGELYSPNDDTFSGGNAFAAHAVTTAHGLLVEANYTLSALYGRLLERAAQDVQTAASRAAHEGRLAHERAQTAANALAYAEAQAQAQFRAQVQTQEQLPEPLHGETAVAAPEQGDADETEETDTVDWQAISHHGDGATSEEPSVSDSGFAETYKELLRRVTAVEVFANNEDMKAAPDARQKLLPLVEDLREGLSKLNRVA